MLVGSLQQHHAERRGAVRRRGRERDGAELVAGLVAPVRELAQRVGVDLALEQLHAARLGIGAAVRLETAAPEGCAWRALEPNCGRPHPLCICQK